MSNQFKAGQVWAYKSRNSEPESKLLILQIDIDEQIYHISINGLKINNPSDSNEPIDEIEHCPFSLDALNSSVVKHCDDIEVPDFAEGYNLWRAGYENDETGVFSLTVAEAVQFMDEAINEIPPEN